MLRPFRFWKRKSGQNVPIPTRSVGVSVSHLCLPRATIWPALVHGLTVATRNVVDFERMGVGVLNPWESVSTVA